MVNYCQKCGTRVDAEDEFCPDCGAKVKGQIGSTSSNPKVAVVLGAIFGPFGYLYLRKFARLVLGIIFWIFLMAVTKGKAFFVLQLFFAADCYRLAKKAQ